VTGDGPVRFRDVVIVGGGCYGTFYARQLLAAQQKGRAEFARLLIVDRERDCQFMREVGERPDAQLVHAEWNDFFDGYLGTQSAPLAPLAPLAPVAPDAPDVIVPSPLMPHLMYHWLERRARQRWPERTVVTHPLERGPGTPYDRMAPDGTRYVSYADWLCPTHCIEPATCPVIRAPRSWEMSEALALLALQVDAAGHVAFTCEHQVFGVGTFPVADVLAGDALVECVGQTGAEADILVGTISHCHGAVNLLHLGASRDGSLILQS
jgi:hypothetical protein